MSRQIVFMQQPTTSHAPSSLRILVVGATRGTGLATVKQLLELGHRVTAFSRSASSLDLQSDRLRLHDGDATNAEDVGAAVEGHDAVVVTLGISDNPLRVRLVGPKRTPLDVRSRGTANVIAAMRKHGVRRLVVQTTFGVGATRDRLGWMDRMFFTLLLKPQIDDTEIQNRAVITSELDWVVAQPVHLTDDAQSPMPFLSAEGETGAMKVSRGSVARFLAQAATSADYLGRSVAVSGAQVRQ